MKDAIYALEMKSSRSRGPQTIHSPAMETNNKTYRTTIIATMYWACSLGQEASKALYGLIYVIFTTILRCADHDCAFSFPDEVVTEVKSPKVIQ